jgi:hypothetical protein
MPVDTAICSRAMAVTIIPTPNAIARRSMISPTDLSSQVGNRQPGGRGRGDTLWSIHQRWRLHGRADESRAQMLLACREDAAYAARQ